ncbi:MAG: hypothetical protein GDA55_07550 [Cellvibrionales bacterium]|nr:hypothetical protein [Cellvibrionales bacterium]
MDTTTIILFALVHLIVIFFIALCIFFIALWLYRYLKNHPLMRRFGAALANTFPDHNKYRATVKDGKTNVEVTVLAVSTHKAKQKLEEQYGEDSVISDPERIEPRPN